MPVYSHPTSGRAQFGFWRNNGCDGPTGVVVGNWRCENVLLMSGLQHALKFWLKSSKKCPCYAVRVPSTNSLYNDFQPWLKSLLYLPGLHHTYSPEPHPYRHRIIVALDKLQIETYIPVDNHEANDEPRNQPPTTMFSALWSETITTIPRRLVAAVSLFASMFSAQRVSLVIVNSSSANSALLDVAFDDMTWRSWRGYHKQRVLRDRRLVISPDASWVNFKQSCSNSCRPFVHLMRSLSSALLYPTRRCITNASCRTA
ncbi:hypothetical protein BJ165DRAFT_1547022 [Panaeolus papilionaceus]|nr:hypothetical protein BJ165DRAFT_1547022 [Panaeolus papilionaceus]